MSKGKPTIANNEIRNNATVSTKLPLDLDFFHPNPARVWNTAIGLFILSISRKVQRVGNW
jgi:hypothetical protein